MLSRKDEMVNSCLMALTEMLIQHYKTVQPVANQCSADMAKRVSALPIGAGYSALLVGVTSLISEMHDQGVAHNPPPKGEFTREELKEFFVVALSRLFEHSLRSSMDLPEIALFQEGEGNGSQPH